METKEVELLNNFDIELLLKKINVPLTQLCRIENLKIKPSKNSYYIINYDNQHWVCFYVKNNIAVYCDSYGEPPDSKILSFFRKHKLKYTINYQQTQNLNATSCGWFCIAFLYYMHSNRNNKNLYYVISNFNEKFNGDNQMKNDNKLQDYIKSIFKK